MKHAATIFVLLFAPSLAAQPFDGLSEVIDGEAVVTIYLASGGVFLQPDPVTLIPWGTGRFIAVDCSRVDFEFQSDEAATTIPLTRITGYCFEAPE